MFSHSVGSLFVHMTICLPEPFQFLQVPFVNGRTQRLSYRCFVQTVVSYASALNAIAHVLFCEAQCIWFLVEVLDPLGREFCAGWLMDTGSNCILLRAHTTLTSTLFKVAFFFPVCRCQKTGIHRYVNLCVGLQLDRLDQCAWFHATTIQFLVLYRTT